MDARFTLLFFVSIKQNRVSCCHSQLKLPIESPLHLCYQNLFTTQIPTTKLENDTTQANSKSYMAKYKSSSFKYKNVQKCSPFEAKSLTHMQHVNGHACASRVWHIPKLGTVILSPSTSICIVTERSKSVCQIKSENVLLGFCTSQKKMNYTIDAPPKE